MKKLCVYIGISVLTLSCSNKPEVAQPIGEDVTLSNEVEETETRILPSWSDGRHRDRILDFVARVTDTSSLEFVEPEERIAVFDNDGTLWSEQPMYFQLYFALDRAELLGIEHPEEALEGGSGPLLDLIAWTHTAMTAREFAGLVTAWLDTAKHPETNKPFTDMVYQPMLELLDYLLGGCPDLDVRSFVPLRGNPGFRNSGISISGGKEHKVASVSLWCKHVLLKSLVPPDETIVK